MTSIPPVRFSGVHRNPLHSLYQAPEKVMPVHSHPIRFGMVYSMAAMVTGQAGNSLLKTGVDALLYDTEQLSHLGDLHKLAVFNEARTFLSLSANTTNRADRQKYLSKAETAYIKSATRQHYSLLAATCWTYAALCAKEGNKDQAVVDFLCEQAGHAFDDSRKQIVDERDHLMMPYTLNHLPRLIFKSPILAIASSVYYFAPSPDTSQRARKYFIKSGYGEEELKRVEQNENLARRFNNGSTGLLDTLSNLHSSHQWHFDPAQEIPVEVPLTKKIFGFRHAAARHLSISDQPAMPVPHQTGEQLRASGPADSTHIVVPVQHDDHDDSSPV